MADNVAVTAGSGTTIATDQLGTGEHVQYMKLMDGALDGTSKIGGDATNGLDVDVTRVSGTVTVDSELTTADLDTGGATDTRAVVGIALAASGGAQLLPGDSTNGLKAQITIAPAATRATDSVASALQTDAIMTGNTVLTPKFAKITASASGATSIVAAVAAKKIRVLRWSVVCNAAVNAKWQSATTDITGLHYFAANGGISEAFAPVGHFETAVNEALQINLSGAIAVGGSLTYVEV